MTLLLLFAGSQANAQSLTDPVGLLDAADQAASYAPTVGDPLGLLDDVTRAVGVERAATDPVGLLDDVAALVVQEREITDPLDLLDPLEAEAGVLVEVTDPLELLDEAGAGIDFLVEATDPVGLLDEQTVEFGVELTVGDAIGLTDVADFPWWTTVLGTDRSGLSRIVLGFAADTSTASDPVEISDSVTAVVPTAERTITDPVGVHDPTDVPRFVAVLGSDASLLSRIILGLATEPQGSTDVVGLTDSVTVATLVLGRTITDAVAIHDPTDVPRFTGVLGSEASLLSWFVLGYGAVPPRAPIDPLGLADSLELAIGTVLAVADDPVGLADSLELTRGVSLEATDALGLADDQELSWDREVSAADDPVGLADSVAFVLNEIELTLGDVLGLADDVEVFSHTIVTLPGHVTLSVVPAAGLGVITTAAAGLAVTVTRGPDLETTLAAAEVGLTAAHDDDLLVSLSP